MDRDRQTRRLCSPARHWLAALLALVWLALAGEAASHHCGSAVPAHHDCAACQMAHGTMLADGCVGVAVPGLPAAPAGPPFWHVLPSSAFDLLLSPGRAPPA